MTFLIAMLLAAGPVKEAKIVYDVTEGDAAKLLGRIEGIEGTRQELAAQGMKPHIVLSFRGGATKLVQTDMEKVKPEDRPIAQQIQAKLSEMSKSPGVKLEQCAQAIKHAGTRKEDVIPVIVVVDNAYITLMRWEQQGYAYIIP